MDPQTGEVVGEITGLTIAVDVAVDESGNIFVVEMSADYADLFESGADLEDANATARHGGYLRFSGELTVYPQDGSPPRILAGELDAPTNITLAADGAFCVSTDQGTPGRPIPGRVGPTTIVGEVVRITGF